MDKEIPCSSVSFEWNFNRILTEVTEGEKRETQVRRYLIFKYGINDERWRLILYLFLQKYRREIHQREFDFKVQRNMLHAVTSPSQLIFYYETRR